MFFYINHPNNPGIVPPDLPCDNDELNLDLDWDNVSLLDVIMNSLLEDFFQIIKSQTNRYSTQRLNAAKAQEPMRHDGIMA